MAQGTLVLVAAGTVNALTLWSVTTADPVPDEAMAFASLISEEEASEIDDDSVTNAKLANMAAATIKGRASGAGTGDPTDLTAAQVKTILDFTESVQDVVGAMVAASGTGLSVAYNDGAGTVTYTLAQGTESTVGVLELATTGEAAAGVDTARAVTAAGVAAALGAVSGMPSGVMAPYAGTVEPTGWLLCYGQDVSRATYSALFTAIGTTYGVGDGATTFALPDMRGRAAFGKDNMGGSTASRVTNANSGIVGTTLGAAGGDERLHSHGHSASSSSTESLTASSTFTGSAMGTHTHTWSSTGATKGLEVGGGAVGFAGGGGDTSATITGSNSATSAGTPAGTVSTTIGGTIATTTTVSSNGSGAAQNMPPAVILNYIIKT